MARGYQNYRGRRSLGTKLLIAFLVLILLAACAFMVIQRYASYTDDNQIDFNLPSWQDLFQKEEQQPPDDDEDKSQDGQAVDLVIDPPPEPEPEPDPVVTIERRLLVLNELPAGRDGLAESLTAAGANGFVYPIRDNTGRVFYASASAANKAAVVDEAGTQSLRELCAGESMPVARFNCFHDSYYAFLHMKEAAICQKTGYVWYDNNSHHWLDPSKEQARSYVIGLAVECAQLGFDELLLEELAYPVRGKLEKIDYSGNEIGKTEALALFLTELRTALEPYGTKLSLLIDEELLQSGTNETSGMDLTALAPLVDAVYAPAADPAAAEALLQGYVGEAQMPEFVPMVSEAREGDWCLTAG